MNKNIGENGTWEDMHCMFPEAKSEEKRPIFPLFCKLAGKKTILVASLMKNWWRMMTNYKISLIDIFCLMFNEDMILIWYFFKNWLKWGQICDLVKYSSLVSAIILFFLDNCFCMCWYLKKYYWTWFWFHLKKLNVKHCFICYMKVYMYCAICYMKVYCVICYYEGILCIEYRTNLLYFQSNTVQVLTQYPKLS